MSLCVFTSNPLHSGSGCQPETPSLAVPWFSTGVTYMHRVDQVSCQALLQLLVAAGSMQHQIWHIRSTVARQKRAGKVSNIWLAGALRPKTTFELVNTQLKVLTFCHYSGNQTSNDTRNYKSFL